MEIRQEYEVQVIRQQTDLIRRQHRLTHGNIPPPINASSYLIQQNGMLTISGQVIGISKPPLTIFLRDGLGKKVSIPSQVLTLIQLVSIFMELTPSRTRTYSSRFPYIRTIKAPMNRTAGFSMCCMILTLSGFLG